MLSAIVLLCVPFFFFELLMAAHYIVALGRCLQHSHRIGIKNASKSIYNAVWQRFKKIKKTIGATGMDKQKIHGVWSNSWIFILAATGSAVGLGNIWKFPYMTGENGGGAFVLVYLLCIALIGLPIMMAEVLLGRRGRMSPISSMQYLTREAGLHGAWTSIGWMGVLAGLFIMSFYSVVAGWALYYVFATGAGNFAGATAESVNNIWGSLLGDKTTLTAWHSLFTFLTGAVVAAGVTKGLGAVARYMMPFLILALFVLLGYGIVEGNFAAGVEFLFNPDFSRLVYKYVEIDSSGQTIACSGAVSDCIRQVTYEPTLKALGHAFFTLSLGMGAIMAYGAYMPEHSNVAKTVVTIGLLDTVIALIAGMAIFSIVFANPGLSPGSGPGLMFQSLPIAFGNMPFGQIFGTLFFLLVSVAAWSSAVSLIEPGVAWLVEKKNFGRISASVVLSGAAWTTGILAMLSFNVLADWTPVFLVGKNPFDFLDFITSQVMLPLGGLFIAIFVGWKMSKAIVASEMDAEGHPLFDIWIFVLRYISPVLVAAVFVFALYETVVKFLSAL